WPDGAGGAGHPGGKATHPPADHGRGGRGGRAGLRAQRRHDRAGHQHRRRSDPVMIERVNPPELGTPRGLSHAVVDSGKVVLLAGQTALNQEGRIVGDTVVEQFEQALGNLLASLSAAGGTPADLASLTVYIVDMGDYSVRFRDIGCVWLRLIGGHYPAVAGLGVSRMWDVKALVEVQGMSIFAECWTARRPVRHAL